MGRSIWSPAADAIVTRCARGGKSALDAQMALAASGFRCSRGTVIRRSHALGTHFASRRETPAGKPAAHLARLQPRVAARALAGPSTPAVRAAPSPAPALLRAQPPGERFVPGEIVTVGRTFLALETSLCRWPVGDAADPETGRTTFLFCCGPKAGRGPYCAAHAGVAARR